MIQRDYVKAWSVEYPWRYSEMVEQDLIICRAIVSIFSDPFLAKELAWKGGTALHKLYLKPQPRYSEDIDLVLIHPEPMGPILDRLREVLSFVPDMQAKGKRYNHVLKLRFVSEANVIPCRNMAEKLKDADYRCGMNALLRPGVAFDPEEAWANVRANIVDRLMTGEDRTELRKALTHGPCAGGGGGIRRG